MSEELREVTIYADGAAEPNPGPGGYGVVLISGVRRKELSGMFRLTTNNRMEILAAIVGLEALKEPCKVVLCSDSKYLIDAMTRGWATRWRANEWRISKGGTATNVDLWERLLALCEKHQVEFKWVRGHAGNRENERCDQLSMQFLGQKDLATDEGYEHKPEKASPKQVKITREGQPCRKCSTPVIMKTPNSKPKRDQAYYFEYYLYCPQCHTMYMVENARRYFE